MPNLFVKSTAELSDCGLYRYRLSRTWDHSLPVAYWIMLNPSTADAEVDDPTIRRCIGFARSWECGGIDVRNLFALRATDPKELLASADPVGKDNDPHHLTALATRAKPGPVIAAWGAGGVLLGRDRRVLHLLKHWGLKLHCLGTTKDGHPRHPLYARGDLQPVPFSPEVVRALPNH